MSTAIVAAPPAPPAPVNAGAPAGDSHAPARVNTDALETALMAASQPAPVENENDPAKPAPEADPDNPNPPAEEGAPGEPESETPETPANGDEPAAGEKQTVLSQDEQTELVTAFAALSPTERKSALEAVKLLEPGEIPRVGKLLSERHQNREAIEALNQTVEKLTAERDEAVARPGNGPASSENIPPAVAKLKTVQEVTQRTQTVKASIRELNRFLENNPQGGEIGGKAYTREELVDRKYAFEDELEALPVHGAAIQQRAQLTQVQATNRQQLLADHPELKDPENPVTKLAREFIKNPDVAKTESPDYLAACLAKGHLEFQKQLAAKSKPAPRPNVPTPGKIPVGKPSMARGSAPAARPAAVVPQLPKPGARVREMDLEDALLSANGKK